MNPYSVVKKILAVGFVAMLVLGFVKNGSYTYIERLEDYLQQDFEQPGTMEMSSVESEYASNMWKQRTLVDINGMMAKTLKMQGYYSNIGMYITDENYIVSASDYTTTDYEYEQTVALRDFLAVNGINLLYVNKPTKYVDDSIFLQFGVESFSNQNADCFLARLNSANVKVIDLRENIEKDNLVVSDLFYRTDHHWTTGAGLWATQIIAEELNEKCGYSIDTSIYDADNFVMKEWSECWLGEQGRKISQAYIGLDDYTETKPAYGTNFTFKNEDGTTWDGTFDDFVDEDVYNTDIDVYENGSWHYSYRMRNCINNDVSYGKVLILGDSYDCVTQPFLALGVHEIDTLVLRDCADDFELRNYILENGYDTVIIAYAQFMVGAHDDVASANYDMFTFE